MTILYNKLAGDANKNLVLVRKKRSAPPSGFVQRRDSAVLPLDEDLSSLLGGGGVRQAHGVLCEWRPLAGHGGAGDACIRPGSVRLQDTHHLLPPGQISSNVCVLIHIQYVAFYSDAF